MLRAEGRRRTEASLSLLSLIHCVLVLSVSVIVNIASFLNTWPTDLFIIRADCPSSDQSWHGRHRGHPPRCDEALRVV